MQRKLIIGVSGIRGIVFDPLSPEVVCRLTSAFATVQGAGRYVVGRDTRPSGEALKHAVIAGLNGVGCDAIDIGICPTPTIQVAVEELGATGGIAITASHNPSDWNALKLIGSDGTFLSMDTMAKVKKVFEESSVRFASYANPGLVEVETSACERHIARIRSLPYIDFDRIANRRFRVALDCTNGAGSAIVPALLEELGCDVMGIDCELSGIFTRNPEPVGANLGRLCEAVKGFGADVGFALDPDGDRLSIVDETGSPIGEEYTLVLCADFVLGRKKGDIVTNLSTTRAIDFIAGRHKVTLHRTPIGEANVVRKMKEVKSPIGGEGNGGVILADVHFGRDALVGICLVLAMLAEYDGSLSQVMNNYPRYDIVKMKIPLEQFDIEELEDLRLKITKELGGLVNEEDGIRVDLDQGWVHLRKSGTEPVIRLIAEGETKRIAEDLIGRVRKLLSM